MQAQNIPQRKYALTKIQSGDYILPGNDGQTLYRLTTYEDGPSHGLVDWPRDRTFWGVWRYTRRVSEGGSLDVDNWDDWEMVGTYCETRKDAIDEALRLGAASKETEL